MLLGHDWDQKKQADKADSCSTVRRCITTDQLPPVKPDAAKELRFPMMPPLVRKDGPAARTAPHRRRFTVSEGSEVSDDSKPDERVRSESPTPQPRLEPISMMPAQTVVPSEATTDALELAAPKALPKKAASGNSAAKARTRAGASGSDTPSVALPHQVEDIFELDTLPDWHMLYVFVDAHDGSGQQWSRERAARGPTAFAPARIPADIKGILVMCEPESYKAVEQLIAELARANEDTPPIIVMFLGSHDADRKSIILQAQAALQDIGIDEVRMLPDARVFDVAFSMAAMSAASKCVAEAEIERGIARLQNQVHDLQRSMWSQVHHSLPEFPRIHFDGPEDIAPGEKVGDCTLYHKVGTGRLGMVYAARNHRLERNEAIKVIDKDLLSHVSEIRDLYKEVTMLNRLDHENVVKFYDFFNTERFLTIHMGFAGSCNMFRYMCNLGGKVPVEQSQALTAQLAQAISHCHERGVAHCDVKPENVVVNKRGSHVTLVDFGLAVETGRTYKEIKGTMPFIAPEVFSHEGYDPAPLDIWALGVLVLEMLCGLRKLNRMMQWDAEPATLRHETLRGDLLRFFRQPEALHFALVEDEIMPERRLVSMLEGMLEVKPEQRWTHGKLVESEWFDGLGG
jgi:hypothetical protein